MANNRDGLFNVQLGDILSSHHQSYKVEAFLGQGTFGKVAKCRVQGTNETVAVKIVRNDFIEAAKHEAKALEKVRKLDPDKNNLLRCTEGFLWRDHLCVTYELLDLNLFDFMVKRNYKPLHLNEIRAIGYQLLISLRALKSIGLVHADIKPDNIMLVNSQLNPKVKLIDFGLATEPHKMRRKHIMQNVGFRSPEALLHMANLDERIDMWALGCVLAFLYLCDYLIPCESPYEAMRMIVQLNGMPDVDFLDTALDSDIFFDLIQERPKHMWVLKSPEQYKLETGEDFQEYCGDSSTLGSLDSLIMRQPERKVPIVFKDTITFISLLKEMLAINPNNRISPTEALCHDFFTLGHLPKVSNYCARAQEVMSSIEEKNIISSPHEEENGGPSGSYISSGQDEAKAARWSSNAISHVIDKGSHRKEESIKAPGISGKLSGRNQINDDIISKEDGISVTKDTIGDQNQIHDASNGEEDRISEQPNNETSEPTCVIKAQKDPSADLLVASSPERTSTLTPVSNDLQEESAKQLPGQVHVDKVKSVKSLRGLRKFFCRLFKKHKKHDASEEVTSGPTAGTDDTLDVKDQTCDVCASKNDESSECKLVTKPQQEPSDVLAVISSGENMSTLTPVSNDQQGESAKQLPGNVDVGEVKSVKRFRGIRKFFSRLFRFCCIHVPTDD